MKRTKILNKLIISIKGLNIKNWTLSLILGLVLAGGITFAWNAVWHGTDWIDSGKIITAKELAEDLEYLKKRLDDTNTVINNYHNSTSSNTMVPTPKTVHLVKGAPSYGSGTKVKLNTFSLMEVQIYVRDQQSCTNYGDGSYGGGLDNSCNTIPGYTYTFYLKKENPTLTAVGALICQTGGHGCYYNRFTNGNKLPDDNAWHYVKRLDDAGRRGDEKLPVALKRSGDNIYIRGGGESGSVYFITY